MRNRVLELLREKKSSFLSGEKMARMLSVSRTAIWKNIQSLQTDGYIIESSPRRGYRLVKIPNMLFPAEIIEQFPVPTKIIASIPEKIYHYRQIESTNNTLKNLASEGASEGTVLIAEEQTQGRGRLGRSWSAPYGKGVYLSILLRPPLEPRQASLFTLLAAAAVAKSVLSILPDLNIGIKWPNDILIDGRKVCGILTELKAEADLLHYIIIGIGINVNFREKDFPPELTRIATSLFLANNKREVARQKLAGSLLWEMDRFYRNYLLEGPEVILSAWKKYNLTLGRQVILKTVSDNFVGLAVDLASDGALVIEDEKGNKKRFHAGEVTLRNWAGEPDQPIP